MIIAETILLLSVSTAVAAERGTAPHLSASGPVRAAQSAPASTADDRVAVVVFANISGVAEDDWIGIGIAETLAAELEHAGDLSVVGRQAVSGALESVSRAAGMAGATELAAGRLLGARWVVSGGYQRVGDRMRITARVVEVVTATVVHSAIVDGLVPELFALQDWLAAELRRGLTDGGDAVASSRAASAPPVGARALAPETLTRDAAGRATVRAVRLTGSWRLDGVLDEAIYEEVPPVAGFIQQLPDEGAPSTEQTEAWVFYDAQNVYVSARLWDSAPASQLVANEMRRDSRQLTQNDFFSVVLDTFYDRRNGVAFLVNPIGGFMDFQVSDEGNPNMDWNPIWDVRTGRFDGGWTAELEIPFKSLRFRPGTSQIWGLQLGRRIRRKTEATFLTPVPINAVPGEMRVSAASTLTGVDVPEGNRTFEVKPYAIGSLATDARAVPRISNEGDGDVGFDVKYGVTENLTTDFTYNTDFAQVEVDEQQVNLTRFSLFFPEKREFFLEGQGIFDFGRPAGGGQGGPRGGRGGGGFFGGPGDVPAVFFSRRIGLEHGQTVPILGGGRLTGKAGAFSIGALNIQTDDTPGASAVATNFTVVRVKRDILRRSRIGGIFTGRSVSTVGPGSNEVYGLDAAFSFYENVNFNGYYARTRTPGLEGDNASYQAAFNYNGDLYGFQVDHLLVGDHFNPEVGFLRRDDFRRTFTSAHYSPRPAAIRAVRQIHVARQPRLHRERRRPG